MVFERTLEEEQVAVHKATLAWVWGTSEVGSAESGYEAVVQCALLVGLRVAVHFRHRLLAAPVSTNFVFCVFRVSFVY